MASRFLEVAGARPLQADERLRANEWLRPEEASSYFEQPPADQRHGLEAALSARSERPERVDLIRAALLHDIGKRKSGLGLIGRSMASAWSKLGGRSRGRWAVYLDHGAVGAEELSALGAEAIVVDFARNHHGIRPGSISEGDWEVMVRADLGGKAERRGRGQNGR